MPKQFLTLGAGVILLILLFFIFSPEPAILPLSEPGNTQSISVIADSLEIPWDIAFLPENEGLLVTERGGRVVHIDAAGEKTAIPIENVKTGGEGGLLGIVLHPDFKNNRQLYLYLTAPGRIGTENRIVRYRFENRTLIDDGLIMSGIPGAAYHDGGRMEFGPDGMLYVTTGDAGDENIAQDTNSLGGKILRLEDDGKIPADNPFGTAVYSYGHRNPQGLTWDSAGRLWATEHGRSGIQSGLDEINLIRKGANYGWPVIEGDETRAGMVSPALHSGARTTWAPASAALIGNRLFFGGLAGVALYEALLEGERVTQVKAHFKNEFGRIRTVRLGPDGMLYLTTSNRDGRGTPADKDDKIIRVDPASL